MLLHKLHLITPAASTRRALSARLVTGAQPDPLITRIRLYHQPDAHGAPAKRVSKSPL